MKAEPCQIVLHEWERLTPEPGSPLRGLFLDDPAIRRICQELGRREMLIVDEQRTGLAIRTTSFVGRLDLGPLQITIQPKIPAPRLLTLLRYAYGLRWLEPALAASYLTTTDAFQELLVAQLSLEAQELLGRGLHRAYRAIRADLTSPRGRIDMGTIMRQGGVITDRLTCVWHPRSEDCLPNQILLQGILLGAQLTQSSATRATLQRLAAQLKDDASPIALTSQTFLRYRREANRLLTAYQPSVTLIELLTESQGILLDDAQGAIHLPGFLFDMNRFFQSLISRFLADHLRGHQVQEEYRLTDLFAYDPEHNPRGRRTPTPRPDFAVSDGHHPIAFLDTKYRDLWDLPLPPEMLYQLAIYALSGSAGDTATILYATATSTAREAQIAVRDPIRATQRATVNLRPVDLLKLERIISSPASRTQQNQAEGLAAYFAFGDKPPMAA